MTWVAKLLPKEEQFFPLFEKHAGHLTAAASALAQLLKNGSGADEISRIEKEANADARRVLDAVRSTFVTPFNRVDIKSLISDMNACLHAMRKVARAAVLFNITEFDPPMQKLAALIVEDCRILQKAMPLLAEIDRHAVEITDLCTEIVTKNEAADEIANEGLKTIIERGKDDPIGFHARNNIYDHLAAVIEQLDAVAEDVHNVVIDQI